MTTAAASGMKQRPLAVDPAINKASDLETNKATRVSYEDTEGLLTTLGVVAALVLSFIVGIIVTIPMEEMALGDFRHNLNHGKENGFRDHVMRILDQQEFNYTATPIVDVKQVLLDAPGQADGSFSPWVGKIDAAFHLIKSIPEVVDYSSAFTAIDGGGRSGLIMTQGGLATTIITVVLFGDIAMYLALATTSARETAQEGDYGPIKVKKKKIVHASLALQNMLMSCFYACKLLSLCKRFNKIGLPCLGALYLLLLIGMVVFFIAMCNMVALRTPSMVLFSLWRQVYFFGIMVSFGIILIGVASYAWYFTEQRRSPGATHAGTIAPTMVLPAAPSRD
jgi:hypothetical protein